MSWLDDVRTIAEQATPGPWFVCCEEKSDASHVVADREPVGGYDIPEGDRDAEFIATFDPVMVSALLEVAEAGQRWRDAWNRDFALTGEETKARRLEFFAALDSLEGHE